MTETLIVIPYLASQAQGDELSLALAGWRQHFCEPRQIVVVGDKPDAADMGEDLIWINCPRIDKIEGQYTPHIDIVHKFRTVREAFPKARGFIYACDDMYAVKDFGLAEVKALKLPVPMDVPPMDWRKESGWMRDLGKTWSLNRKEGTPCNWNWVCHLPVYYDWNRLIDIYDCYDCDNNSYIVENIYFNQRKPRRADMHLKSEYGYEVLMAGPGIATAEEAGKIWITNANCGWSKELERLLRRHYGMN